MKEGLLNKIKSRGFWRINYQPSTARNRLEMLKDCENIVEKYSIDLRGWDYPHIPRRNDEDGKILRVGEFIEAWEDWGAYKEFWRMYKSGQFLYYRGLREDWFEEDVWREHLAKKILPEKFLGITLSVIYEVTEIFLFLARLTQGGLYENTVTVNISLNNIEGRELWIEDQNKIPFFSTKRANARLVSYSERYKRDDIINNHRDLSTDIILRVFDTFGWNPQDDFIKKEQELLLSGKV